MKLASLNDLYLEQLRDLHSAETQILKALPKMAKAASDQSLKSAFQDHLDQTKGHVERLDEILGMHGASSKTVKCKAMEGIVAEGAELLDADAEEAVRDAALIAAAQRVEHYEIAAYGSAATFANQLGFVEAEGLLRQTLEEETTADRKLTQLATQSINEKAGRVG